MEDPSLLTSNRLIFLTTLGNNSGVHRIVAQISHLVFLLFSTTLKKKKGTQPPFDTVLWTHCPIRSPWFHYWWGISLWAHHAQAPPPEKLWHRDTLILWTVYILWALIKRNHINNVGGLRVLAIMNNLEPQMPQSPLHQSGELLSITFHTHCWRQRWKTSVKICFPDLCKITSSSSRVNATYCHSYVPSCYFMIKAIYDQNV